MTLTEDAPDPRQYGHLQAAIADLNAATVALEAAALRLGAANEPRLASRVNTSVVSVQRLTSAVVARTLA